LCWRTSHNDSIARGFTGRDPRGSHAHDRLDGQRAGVPYGTLGRLIVDPEAHDTLYAHNAAKLFIPASNQKLVSSSVMLEQLGPEFRFARRSPRMARSRTGRSTATLPSSGAATRP
jgi:D-alanyl-D-alanine carboxypeptidase